jgi:hypothetical protein
MSPEQRYGDLSRTNAKPQQTSSFNFENQEPNLPKFNNLSVSMEPPQRKPSTPSLYTLVLDMDETLVHFDPRRRNFRTRPHVLNFLKEISQQWEVVVFTAGLKDYADWILNDLDPNRYISRRLYRDSCTFRRGSYLKDLKKVGRNLSRCVIVDNLPENFSLQRDNGIGIKSWFADNN